MIAVIVVIAVTVFSVIFLTFITMQIRIRDFRFDLFRIRDEVRYAFIREMTTVKKEERKLLENQFIEFQELINSMLNHPTFSQIVILKLIIEKRRGESQTEPSEEFATLPLLFQRQVVFLAQAVIRTMGADKPVSFAFYVLFRLFIFAYLELLALKCEVRLNKLDKSIIERKERIVLPSSSQAWRQRKHIKDYREKPVGLAESILLCRKEIQDFPSDAKLAIT